MSSSSRKIVLKSSDGETFETEEAVAQLSPMIKHMIDSNFAGTCISIPNVTGDILPRVIVYCRNHVNTAALKSFDSEFISVEEPTLFRLAAAARVLDIKNMSDLLSEAIADRRKKRRSGRNFIRVDLNTFV